MNLGDQSPADLQSKLRTLKKPGYKRVSRYLSRRDFPQPDFWPGYLSLCPLCAWNPNDFVVHDWLFDSSLSGLGNINYGEAGHDSVGQTSFVQGQNGVHGCAAFPSNVARYCAISCCFAGE